MPGRIVGVPNLNRNHALRRCRQHLEAVFRPMMRGQQSPPHLSRLGQRQGGAAGSDPDQA